MLSNNKKYIITPVPTYCIHLIGTKTRTHTYDGEMFSVGLLKAAGPDGVQLMAAVADRAPHGLAVRLTPD